MQVHFGLGFRQTSSGGGGGGGGSMTGAEIVAALANPSTTVRALTARLWQDLGQASPEGAIDPEASPMPYAVAVTTENTVGVEWDDSRPLLATLEETKAGVAGLVATFDVVEAARSAGAEVTWDGAEVLDLNAGATLYANLMANSVVTLFANARTGVDFLFAVENAGAFTVAFQGIAGVTLMPLNAASMTAATGAGAVTVYVGTFITASIALIARVGVYTP